MTNATSSNFGWEVAGGKKNAKKLNDDLLKKSNGKLAKEAALSKIPKLEVLPPLKADASIYDLIRESDDDEDDENNNKNKQKQNLKKTANGTANGTATQSSNKSPKQQNQQRKPQQEPINLLASSMISAQKKKAPSSPLMGKNAESELEKVMAQLTLEEFEQQANSVASFQNILITNQHLVSYLNQKLNNVPEIEPSANHQNESSFPLVKLDKKIVKFLNVHLSKLNRNDSEKFYESCFDSLFNDSSKIASLHGFKVYIQLIVKHSPHLLSNNLNRYAEIINSNKHKHQRCLTALWALGQVGYHNLSNGLRIWFDCMLPFTTIKGTNNYVLTYLQSLFEHHKVDSKTEINSNVINLDNYLRLYDLVNDKTTVLPKDTALKLKSSFQTLKSLFQNDLNQNGSDYFETLLKLLSNEKTEKRTEFLELLDGILLSSKDVQSKWRQIYSKNLPQTILLLEHITSKHGRGMKSFKDFSETLRFFDEQTTQHIEKSNASQKDSKHQFKKFGKSSSSSSESELIRKLNRIVKVR